MSLKDACVAAASAATATGQAIAAGHGTNLGELAPRHVAERQRARAACAVARRGGAARPPGAEKDAARAAIDAAQPAQPSPAAPESPPTPPTSIFDDRK